MNLKIVALVAMVIALVSIAVVIENQARPPTGRQGQKVQGESR